VPGLPERRLLSWVRRCHQEVKKPFRGGNDERCTREGGQLPWSRARRRPLAAIPSRENREN
jgi:hypothetical protein